MNLHGRVKRLEATANAAGQNGEDLRLEEMGWLTVVLMVADARRADGETVDDRIVRAADAAPPTPGWSPSHPRDIDPARLAAAMREAARERDGRPYRHVDIRDVLESADDDNPVVSYFD
jgi:hypothetical protein